MTDSVYLLRLWWPGRLPRHETLGVHRGRPCTAAVVCILVTLPPSEPRAACTAARIADAAGAASIRVDGRVLVTLSRGLQRPISWAMAAAAGADVYKTLEDQADSWETSQQVRLLCLWGASSS